MTLGDRIVVMKDGVIHQADTPLDTYHRPANRFVAGFVGMPPMNFFDGRVMAAGDQLTFVEGAVNGGAKSANELTMASAAFTLSIVPDLRQRMSAHVGRHVVLGIRPEHLHVRPAEGDVKIEATLNVMEPLGNNMDLYASTCLHDQVVARVEAQAGLQADSRMALFVDPHKAHFFAPGETGMNLCQTSEPAHALA